MNQTISSIRKEQYENMLDIIKKYNYSSEDSDKILKSKRMRSIINSYRLAEAYKGNTKVAYVGEQYPTEIVYAFNVMAWNIESMSILIGQSINIDEYFLLTEENHLSRDICSFLRAPFGMMKANCYPKPDIVLSNDQPCDCLAKLGYIASENYNSPFISLNTPNTITDESVEYLVNQIKSTIYDIEEKLGIVFDEDNFMKTIKYSNEAKSYYRKTIELLKTETLPGIPRELHEIFGMNTFGLKETVNVCKVLYEEAIEMHNNNKKNNNKKRVLWIGQVPEGFHELIVYLDNEVEIIYSTTMWEGVLMDLDVVDPIKSIAKRAILFHWHSQRMKDNAIKICDEYDISGIIISNIWGCRNMLGISSVIREVVNEKKLKCLTINLDLIDRNNYAFNHVKNRIDAFLEIL